MGGVPGEAVRSPIIDGLARNSDMEIADPVHYVPEDGHGCLEAIVCDHPVDHDDVAVASLRDGESHSIGERLDLCVTGPNGPFFKNSVIQSEIRVAGTWHQVHKERL